MAKSMTGYGRVEFRAGAETYSVEVKTLNNRYLEVNLRMPERFYALELRVREEIKKRFSRGSFQVFISGVDSEAPALRLNAPLARAYVEAAEALKKELGVEGDVDIKTLLGLKDIFKAEKPASDADADWQALFSGLTAVFELVEGWREREGRALAEDLSARLASFEQLVAEVQTRVPEVNEAYRLRLKEAIDRLLAGAVDEQRLVQEAAIYAERSDVSEELVRLGSHIAMFRGYLALSEPVGKRLDFLCQEILRETNTVASKSSDVRLTGTVVEMKAILEKIREQAQNIE